MTHPIYRHNTHSQTRWFAGKCGQFDRSLAVGLKSSGSGSSVVAVNMEFIAVRVQVLILSYDGYAGRRVQDETDTFQDPFMPVYWLHQWTARRCVVLCIAHGLKRSVPR